MFTIFIVEDDPNISRLLQAHLQRYGYAAVVAADFDRVLEQFQQLRPELVLLDVSLPKFDGYYWCRQIRLLSHCPILFISAREGKMDQVMALENGADDYITKPFHYEVVVAKIGSHLRRSYGDYSGKRGERTVEVAGLTLYPERLEAALDGNRTELGHKEALLLETLMQRAGRVVSRERLLEKLWDDQRFVDDNTLNVYVTRVRRKLRELNIEEALETVRGQGYLLRVVWRAPS
ncbi:response regulator transcription factor [Paenibacillus cymbidii]|uniref:response regulator transcription factor n=1 Tax=Paenibacillus cymbidii TaxID=1639034 RepID=UPI0010820D04|nr:response regulator transcription factor [Paenibacillus cymbidii]